MADSFTFEEASQPADGSFSFEQATGQESAGDKALDVVQDLGHEAKNVAGSVVGSALAAIPKTAASLVTTAADLSADLVPGVELARAGLQKFAPQHSNLLTPSQTAAGKAITGAAADVAESARSAYETDDVARERQQAQQENAASALARSHENAFQRGAGAAFDAIRTVGKHPQVGLGDAIEQAVPIAASLLIGKGAGLATRAEAAATEAALPAASKFGPEMEQSIRNRVSQLVATAGKQEKVGTAAAFGVQTAGNAGDMVEQAVRSHTPQELKKLSPRFAYLTSPTGAKLSDEAAMNAMVTEARTEAEKGGFGVGFLGGLLLPGPTAGRTAAAATTGASLTSQTAGGQAVANLAERTSGADPNKPIGAGVPEAVGASLPVTGAFMAAGAAGHGGGTPKPATGGGADPYAPAHVADETPATPAAPATPPGGPTEAETARMAALDAQIAAEPNKHVKAVLSAEKKEIAAGIEKRQGAARLRELGVAAMQQGDKETADRRWAEADKLDPPVKAAPAPKETPAAEPGLPTGQVTEGEPAEPPIEATAASVQPQTVQPAGAGVEPGEAQARAELPAGEAGEVAGEEITLNKDGLPIQTGGDVGLVAGMSPDGVTTVHDKGKPDTIQALHSSGEMRPFDVLESHDYHERVEKALLDSGHAYPEAHRAATEAEHARQRQLGFDPNEIEKKLAPFYDEAAHRARAEGNTKGVTTEPYVDEGEKGMLAGDKSDPRYLYDGEGNKYTDSVYGKLMGHEIVTTKAADGSYRVMDPNSAGIFARGKTAKAANQAANARAVKMQKKGVAEWFNDNPPLSQQQLRQRYEGHVPDRNATQPVAERPVQGRDQLQPPEEKAGGNPPAQGKVGVTNEERTSAKGPQDADGERARGRSAAAEADKAETPEQGKAGNPDAGAEVARADADSGKRGGGQDQGGAGSEAAGAARTGGAGAAADGGSAKARGSGTEGEGGSDKLTVMSDAKLRSYARGFGLKDSASRPRAEIEAEIREKLKPQAARGDGWDSVESSPELAPHTADSLRSEIKTGIGDKPLRNMEKSGLLQIHDTYDSLPDDLKNRVEEERASDTVRAFYDPSTGKIHLIADRIPKDFAHSLLMHEIGEHAGTDAFLNDARRAKYVSDLRALRHGGNAEVREAWAKTREAYPHLDENSAQFVHEVAAKLVETNPELPLPKRMMNDVRAWLFRAFGMGKVDVGVARSLAAQALRAAGKGKLKLRTGLGPLQSAITEADGYHRPHLPPAEQARLDQLKDARAKGMIGPDDDAMGEIEALEDRRMFDDTSPEALRRTMKAGYREPQKSFALRASRSDPKDTTGIAHRVSEERGVEAERGEGISAADSVERGRDLLAKGADAEKVMADFDQAKKFNADDMAVVRAHGEALTKAAVAAERQHGTDSPQYQQAAAADKAWIARIKPMQTEWHATGQAQQGETEVDTGTFHGLSQEYFKSTGKDFTPKQAKEAETQAGEVQKADTEVEQAKKKLKAAVGNEKVPTDVLADFKPGGEWTPQQAKALWGAAKSGYLDKGVDSFDEIRHGLATDFGIPVADVTKGLAMSKSLRTITDDMYAKMAQRRRVVNQAKTWLAEAKYPGWEKFARNVPSFFFNLATLGHQTVGMVTHAGINAFDPIHQGAYWTNFGRQFKLAGWFDKGAYHERMMQDLVRDPNFIKAKRAGLANDPFKYQDDYQNADAIKFFKKIGLIGNRGFDALKLFRQARFNQEWDNLPQELKTPDMAKEIASALNHATGVVKSNVGPKAANWILFAPKLEASRWAFLLGDPAKAAKVGFNWKSSTPEERRSAITQVKQKAAIAGMYMGLLALNQGFLSASDSEDKINFTNPKKADFLAFKGHGFKFGVISPLIGTLRFLTDIARYPFESSKDARGKQPIESASQRAGQYLRGKLSPFATLAADAYSSSDFQGRPLPYSSKPVPKHLAKQGITTPYTYGEYASQHLLPIPFEEAAQEVWKNQGATEDQTDKWLKAIGIGLVTGGTGARLSEATK